MTLRKFIIELLKCHMEADVKIRIVDKNGGLPESSDIEIVNNGMEVAVDAR